MNVIHEVETQNKSGQLDSFGKCWEYIKDLAPALGKA